MRIIIKDIHNISKEALARKLSSVETEQIKDAIAEIKQIGLKLLTMRRLVEDLSTLFQQLS